jgi:hypothetical protein
MNMRATALLALVAVACGCASGGSTEGRTANAAPPPVVTAELRGAWPLFGVTPDRRNDYGGATGITASNVTALARRSIGVPGTVDSSPIFVSGRFVVTTSYGKTVALNRRGHIVWTYTPPGVDGWEGSAQITNASPAADPDGEHV